MFLPDFVLWIEACTVILNHDVHLSIFFRDSHSDHAAVRVFQRIRETFLKYLEGRERYRHGGFCDDVSLDGDVDLPQR
jgi:hypothetical protein